MSEWIQTENRMEYKIISTNGAWNVFQIRNVDGVYSFCPYCNFSHDCYQSSRDESGYWGMAVYAPEKEYNFCPSCGTHMGINKEK